MGDDLYCFIHPFTCSNRLLDQRRDLIALFAGEVHCTHRALVKLSMAILEDQRDVLTTLRDQFHHQQTYRAIRTHTQCTEIHRSPMVTIPAIQRQPDYDALWTERNDAGPYVQHHGDIAPAKQTQAQRGACRS